MLQNGTTNVNKRTKKNVYCNTRGLIKQGVLGIGTVFQMRARVCVCVCVFQTLMRSRPAYVLSLLSRASGYIVCILLTYVVDLRQRLKTECLSVLLAADTRYCCI